MNTMMRRLSSISVTSNIGQQTEQDLLHEYDKAIECLTHAESIIAALQQEVRFKDNKIMQISIENAILKAQQDEHHLMTRRMMNNSITKSAQQDEYHNLLTTQKVITESTHGLSDDEYSTPIPSKNKVRRNAILHTQQHCKEQQQVPSLQSLASEANHVPAKVTLRKNGRPIHRPRSYIEQEECTEERSHPRDSSPLGARIAQSPTKAIHNDVVPTNVPPPTQEKNWTTRRQSLLDAVTSEEPTNIGRRLSNFGLALMGFTTKNGIETLEEEEYPKPDYGHNSPLSIHSTMQKRRSSLESLYQLLCFLVHFKRFLLVVSMVVRRNMKLDFRLLKYKALMYKKCEILRHE